MRYVSEFNKPPSHLLKNFAVCDIPLDHINDYNVSRDWCKGLGCCFHKGVCYEKSVSIYVQVFFALILIIAGAFIITTVYRVIQEKREKEVSIELPLSLEFRDKAEAAPSVKWAALKAQAGKASQCDGCTAKDATVTIMNNEETED